MTNESLQAQLADDQLDRLEELLSDPALPEAMRLDEIQGYLLSKPLPADEFEARFLQGHGGAPAS